MTIRLGVLPYGPSDSCRELRNALVAALSNSPVTPRLIRTQNSEFRGRAGDVIVNYGNRSAPAQVFGEATILNPQAALNNAANKLTALTRMQTAGVSVVPFTASRAEAQRWIEQGTTVYSRSTLTGHSGEGIAIHKRSDDGSFPTLPQVPLYTKAITGQRREWRVHVFKGVITYVQVKRRANGYQSNPDYQEEVRNHHTGWIYATENINPTAAVLRNAVNAVAALGLDFGAVDIISYRDDAWVLEVNTAPGLTGTTLETFTRNVVEFVESTRLTRPASYVARFPTPPAIPAAPPASSAAPEVVPTPESPRAATAAPVQPTNVGREVVEDQRPVRESGGEPDGYYIGTVQLSSAGNVHAQVILFRSNGRWFRHGWNAPVTNVSRVTRIESLNVNGATAPVQISII